MKKIVKKHPVVTSLAIALVALALVIVLTSTPSTVSASTESCADHCARIAKEKVASPATVVKPIAFTGASRGEPNPNCPHVKRMKKEKSLSFAIKKFRAQLGVGPTLPPSPWEDCECTWECNIFSRTSRLLRIRIPMGMWFGIHSLK